VPLIDNNNPAPRVHCVCGSGPSFFAIYWRPTVEACKHILLLTSILSLIYPTSKVHDMSDEKKPVILDGESVKHYVRSSAYMNKKIKSNASSILPPRRFWYPPEPYTRERYPRERKIIYLLSKKKRRHHLSAPKNAWSSSPDKTSSTK
jgi:hypothetical protein